MSILKNAFLTTILYYSISVPTVEWHIFTLTFSEEGDGVHGEYKI